MCECFCIGFIDLILNNKMLTNVTKLFSPNNFKKNYEIMLEYFQ